MYSFDPETDPIRDRSILLQDRSSGMTRAELDELGMRRGRKDMSEGDIRESGKDIPSRQDRQFTRDTRDELEKANQAKIDRARRMGARQESERTIAGEIARRKNLRDVDRSVESRGRENVRMIGDKATVTDAERQAYNRQQDRISRRRSRQADEFLRSGEHGMGPVTKEARGIEPPERLEGGEIEEVYSTENQRKKFVDDVTNQLLNRKPKTNVTSQYPDPQDVYLQKDSHFARGRPTGKDPSVYGESKSGQTVEELPMDRDKDGPFFASSEDLSRDLKPPPVAKDTLPTDKGNPKSNRKRFRGKEEPKAKPETEAEIEVEDEAPDLSDVTILSPDMINAPKYKGQPKKPSGLTVESTSRPRDMSIEELEEFYAKRNPKPKAKSKDERQTDAVRNLLRNQDQYNVSPPFSASKVKLPSGSTIEREFQQMRRAAKRQGTELDESATYKRLWNEWADSNPEALEKLRKYSEGKRLVDPSTKAEGPNQARILNEILAERFGE